VRSMGGRGLYVVSTACCSGRLISDSTSNRPLPQPVLTSYLLAAFPFPAAGEIYSRFTDHPTFIVEYPMTANRRRNL
jgi:hypothetical protein